MIEDRNLIQFCNEQIRPIADELARLYYHVEQALDAYRAKGYSTLLPTTPEVINDGSPADGRTLITSVDVLFIVSALERTKTIFEEVDTNLNIQNLYAILKVAVNPNR